MNKIIKCLFLMVLTFISIFSLTSCKEKGNDQITKLSFKSSSSYEYLSSLDGEKVQINGYMATSSPVDGSFIFLMNLPYQSCPFCVPNTSELSNTIEAYPKKNTKFSYTSSAIKVIGTLVVASSKVEPFTDQYGYEFNFKLIDSEYSVLSDEELSDNVQLFQKLSNSNVVNDLYSMYDYINFLCSWPEYFVNSYKDASGNVVPGYYLYASDAINYVTKNNAQFNYGYKDGYFSGIIEKLNNISSTGFDDIIANINSAKELADYALGELENGHYKSEYIYVSRFGTYDYVYTLDDQTLKSKFNNLYYVFSDWLGNFEM